MSEGPEILVPRGIRLRICPNKAALGAAAAARAATIIATSIKETGKARILLATGNSQLETIAALVKHPDVIWPKVVCFHLDEYVGIRADNPASFRYWIRTRFVDKVRIGAVHYIEGDSTRLEEHLHDYAVGILSAPIDLAFVGFGENGHIAFNDPHVADFSDPLQVKRVILDGACRKQQVGEGHFPDLESVPREAVTVTCSGLLRANHWISCVPDARKAKAVKAAFEGPITTDCPASSVRMHPRAYVYLDDSSARLLSDKIVGGLPDKTSALSRQNKKMEVTEISGEKHL